MEKLKTVKIELTPYTAVSILSFCREYINEENVNDYKFKAIHDAVDEYEKQIYRKITTEHLDEVIAENEVNRLIGKFPEQ